MVFPSVSAAPAADRPLLALDSVLQQMRELQDPSELFDLAIAYINHTFHPPFIWLSTYDAATHELVGQGGITLLPEYPRLWERLPLRPGDILEQVAIEQRPITIPDLPQELRMGVWQQEAQRLGVVGCLVFPIRFRRRCLGILLLGSQLWGAIASEEEKALLGILLGQLALSLETVESEWLRQQERHADQPLLALGATVCDVETMQDRAQAAIDQLQAFLNASRVRIFWFEREGCNFFPRWSSQNSLLKQRDTDRSTIFTARELGSMYGALAAGQVVTVEDGKGAARSVVSLKVMQSLRCQSLLAAPILFEGSLLGFLTAETDAPRSWSTAEQDMATGAAYLLALSAPLEQLEVTLNRIHSDRRLTTDIAQAIQARTDWEAAIKQALGSLCEQLRASACYVLAFAPAIDSFHVRLTHRSDNNSRPLPALLGSLNARDWEDLKRVEDAVAVDHYPEDLRLTSWSDPLTKAGARSILAAHTGIDPSRHSAGTARPGFSGVLMVTHKQARSWSRDERQLVKAVAQQVGIVLRQWQLQQQLDGRERLLEQLPTFVRSLQETNSVTDLYALAAEYLVQLLEVPLAGLLTWRESDTSSAAYLRSTSSRHEAFALSSSSQQPISLECDGLLQQCLQAATVPLPLELDALPAETRAWLDAPELAQLLAIASPAPSPDGEAILLFVGADRERCWLPTDGHVLQLWQLAVGHSLNTLLEKQRREQRLAELTELNWCKHRLLTTLQSSLTIGQNRLHQIVQAAQVEAAASPNETHWHKVNKIGHSLSELAADIAPIESEYLQPQPALSTVSVATLIRQTLRHLEAVVQQQKLWPRVHGETKGFVRAEPLRLELVLLELMTFAALRSPNGGRIDVWHQTSIDASAISIVDEGAPLSLSLLDGLAATATGAAVMPSLFQGEPLLQESPGRELNLCQKLVYRMGGTLAFYRSEDNRNVTQLTLPLVPQPESKNSA